MTARRSLSALGPGRKFLSAARWRQKQWAKVAKNEVVREGLNAPARHLLPDGPVPHCKLHRSITSHDLAEGLLIQGHLAPCVSCCVMAGNQTTVGGPQWPPPLADHQDRLTSNIKYLFIDVRRVTQAY